MDAIDLVDEEYINSIIDTYHVDKFTEIVTIINKQRNGKVLTKNEKGVIAIALQKYSLRKAELSRMNDYIYGGCDNSNSFTNILIVTAYSSDYSIGTICESVNRKYAIKYNYEFYSEVLPLIEMSKVISPKEHCTWYKIWLLKKLFSNKQDLYTKKIQYIMWIDADAIIINHDKPLSDIISLGKERDLIIAEDMNTGCLINAGIFLLRTTTWSESLLNDVWNSNRYDNVTYYEQSSIVRVLKQRLERLDTIQPFHSYVKGGYQGPKLFAHTAVLPLNELNSNRGVSCCDVDRYQLLLNTSSDTTVTGYNNISNYSYGYDYGHDDICKYYLSTGNYCDICKRGVDFRPIGICNDEIIGSGMLYYPRIIFAYHPAGMIDKLTLLQVAIWKYGSGINCNLVPLHSAVCKLSSIQQQKQKQSIQSSSSEHVFISSAILSSANCIISNSAIECTELDHSILDINNTIDPTSQQQQSSTQSAQQEFKLIRRSHGKIPTPDQPYIYQKFLASASLSNNGR